MISDEAVIAAAKVLYADKISNHAGDNAPQIIDACEKVARKALEAAAPYILARELEAVAKDLWESAQIIQVRSHDAGIDNEGVIHTMKVDAALLRARAANHRSQP